MGMPPRPRPGSPGPAGSRREGQSHLFTAYAYEWIILSLAVRNYPQRKKMAQQASRQPGLRPRRLGRCSPAVAPIYRGTASRCGGVVCWGDEGGSVTPPLSTSPSLEDPDLGGLHSLPFCCPSNGAQISLSLSLSAPTFPHQGRVSPPALRHPRARWPPVPRRGHPQDPAQNRECREKIDS
jgi:hypothetical protein